MEKRVEVVVSEYVNAHGKAPRGNGNWAFAYGCGRIFTWQHGVSYVVAKRAAVARAKAANVSRIWVCS